jgi:sugar phosphate isomerase/epimerase
VGLEIPNLGTYIRVGDLETVEQAMHFAQIAGAPQIRVGVGSFSPTAGTDYASAFAKAQRFLARVQRLAVRYGIRALVEIHHQTICPSASLAHRLVSEFDPTAIGVIYDPGNMVHEGFENYRLGIELLGPYLAHVHVKNGAYARPASGGVWIPRWAPLEDGVVDLVALFSALHDRGYTGWLSVEDFSQVRASAAALQHNLRLIRDRLALVTDQARGNGGP